MRARTIGAGVGAMVFVLAAAGPVGAVRQLPALLAGAESEPVETVEIPTGGGTVRGTRTRAPHVTLVTYAAPSSRPRVVQLFVEITPEPDTHVYAEGATGYQPVKLTVKAGDGVRLQGTASYPRAVLHRFEALNEIVPVYEGAFRVSQEVRPAVPAPGGQTRPPLVIEGELLYQACTDSICYETETVLLKWSVPQP